MLESTRYFGRKGTSMLSRKDIFTKCSAFDDAKKVIAVGLYPFFRPIESTLGSSVVTAGRRRVMIGSNNYLGLTHHPRVQEASRKAIDKFGTGCTGSRFLNGNLVLHEELEERLAHFVGKEACLVFNSGFLANQGAISTLIGRHDVIYSDRENHASILEGTKVALGETVKFRHNDMRDLERVLKLTREKYEGAMIIADGVFSMSGDIFPIPEALALARQYGARLYIDDAHALGVLGAQGQGTENHFGLSDVDVIVGTFSKSFASLGGFMAASKDVIHYVKHKCRPFIFSAAMPPAALGAVLECLTIVREEPEHLERLWQNARFMSHELKLLGYNTLGSTTPIIPLIIGEDMQAFTFTQKLYEHGIFATPVISPAVPEGHALLRTSYMASHTMDDLCYVLDVLKKLGTLFRITEQENRATL